MGLYEPDYADEAFKLFITFAPGVLGARLLHSGMPCLGAFLIAFSFYLCGWTAHDYLHHAVFKETQTRLVLWNNVMGFLLGMWQGFSPDGGARGTTPTTSSRMRRATTPTSRRRPC